MNSTIPAPTPNSQVVNGSRTDFSSDFVQNLAKHRAFLSEHLQIWQSALTELQPGSEPHSIAQKCFENTKIMITACADFDRVTLAQQADHTSSRKHKRPSNEVDSETKGVSKKRKAKEKPGSPGSKPISYTSPIKDASGLFMIDTNPGDIQSLLQNKEPNVESLEKKKKRRQSQLGSSLDNVDTAPDNNVSQPNKRAKITHIQDIDREVDNDDDHFKAFEAKVQLRLKEKDEMRKQRSNKKRKRDSEVSTVQDGGDELKEGHTGKSLSRKTSKQRRKELKMEPVASINSDSG